METSKLHMLEILQNLGNDELKLLQWHLQQSVTLEGLQPIPKGLLENVDRMQTVDLIVQKYTSNAGQILMNVLGKISRNDLVTRLSLYKHSETSDPVESFPNTTKAIQVKTQTGAHPITRYQDLFQTNVAEPFACLPIGAMPRDDRNEFEECYTRLTVTHIDEAKISSEPVATHMERKKAGQDVQLNKIYKHPSRPNKPIRTVLSTGDAGVGKTFLVHKFLSDWAKKKDQDPHLIFVLPFRQLNLLKGHFSLAQLVRKCIDATKCIPEEALDYIFSEMQISGNTNYDQSAFKVMFVLEGYDECHFKMDFEIDHDCSDDLTMAVPLEVLLVNLIKGNLLRSARLWITTRPAAAKQIPDCLVDLMTEVRGFSDDAIVKYIQKRCRDEKQADRIISHINTSKNLHIMCETPVYCSIIVSVLQHMLQTDEKGELPKTLAGIYCQFLFVQMKRKWLRYGGRQQKPSEADKEVLLKLGRLAFEHLQKGNIIFYKKHLDACNVEIKEGPVDSGLCTEIFKPDSKFFQETVYCFVHLSIQEFLSAVYLFDCFTQEKKRRWFHFFTQTNFEVLKAFLDNDDFNSNSSLADFLNAAMKKALQSENGHLDLFIRFLHGLSLEDNQKLLGGLLDQTENSADEIQRAIINLKAMDPCSGSPDRCINIFQCLMELKAVSVSQGIQQYLESKSLSETQISALVRILLMSEEVLRVLDLQKCDTSGEGRKRLVPAVKNCTTAKLVDCYLKKPHIEVVASALSANPSHLRELDLSQNSLKKCGLDLICTALQSSNCRLEILGLADCDLQREDIEAVASALRSNPPPLRELDLSGNVLRDSGLDLICTALKSPNCCLETLRLNNCFLSESCCEVLASALTSNRSLHLKELDLSLNMVNESGMKMLLSAGLGDLTVKHGGEDWLTNPQLKKVKYFCRFTLDTNTAHRDLVLSENNRKAVQVRGQGHHFPDHHERFDEWPQVLSAETVSERCYSEVMCSGQVSIAGTDRSIGRKGEQDDSRLGANAMSWSLDCGDRSYAVRSSNTERKLRVPLAYSSNWFYRVAVYVDRPAGTLSFYDVSPEDTLVHLHTFQITPAESLCLGFYVKYGSSVFLCEQNPPLGPLEPPQGSLGVARPH